MTLVMVFQIVFWKSKVLIESRTRLHLSPGVKTSERNLFCFSFLLFESKTYFVRSFVLKLHTSVYLMQQHMDSIQVGSDWRQKVIKQKCNNWNAFNLGDTFFKSISITSDWIDLPSESKLWIVFIVQVALECFLYYQWKVWFLIVNSNV